MTDYIIVHRSLLLDDAWADVAREVSDFAATPDTDKVEPSQIISEVPAPMPRPIAAQSAADIDIPLDPEEWASEPVDPSRCAHPGCHGWRASGGPLCKVHALAARYRLPGFGLALALVSALAVACGGPAFVDTPERPAQPCAYVDNDPVYCVCFRLCPGESQCVQHAGRCDGNEPTVCDVATAYARTSTAVWSIALGEACGPDPIVRGL